MIEGLRLLPRIQTQREKAEGAWFFTCDDCDLHNDHDQKRIFRCGWLREDERMNGMGSYPDSTVCPGYSTSLPEVQEAAIALGWRRDGQLKELYDVPITKLLRDALTVLDNAANQMDREKIAEARREAEAK